QVARIFASSSVTGFAGIGIGPQLPCVPFLICPARVSTAPATPAFLAATSLSAGPTSLVSMEWQAAQGLLLNSSSASWAMAGCALSAAVSTNSDNREFLMMFPYLDGAQ